MSYRFDDGMLVEYNGSVHITRGNEIDLFIEEGFIPVKIKADLNEATSKDNRDNIRKLPCC